MHRNGEYRSLAMFLWLVARESGRKCEFSRVSIIGYRYNLFSVYHRGVPPPTIHVHLSLIDPFATPLPGLGTPNSSSANSDASFPPIASSLDAKDFNLWLRDRWALKEKLIDGYFGIEAGQGCGTVKGELLDVEVESGGREVFEIGFSWMDGME